MEHVSPDASLSIRESRGGDSRFLNRPRSITIARNIHQDSFVDSRMFSTVLHCTSIWRPEHVAASDRDSEKESATTPPRTLFSQMSEGSSSSLDRVVRHRGQNQKDESTRTGSNWVQELMWLFLFECWGTSPGALTSSAARNNNKSRSRPVEVIKDLNFPPLLSCLALLMRSFVKDPCHLPSQISALEPGDIFPFRSEGSESFLAQSAEDGA